MTRIVVEEAKETAKGMTKPFVWEEVGPVDCGLTL